MLPTSFSKLPSSFTAFARRLFFGWLVRIKLVFIEILLRASRNLGSRDIWRNPLHRAANHQLRIALLSALALKEIPDNRNIAYPWDFVDNVRDPIIHQPGDDEALTILELELSIGLTRADGGHRGSGHGNRIREVQRTYLGNDMQVDVAIRLNYR